MLPKSLKQKGHSYFTISWGQLRETVLEALTNNGSVAGISSGRNRESIRRHTVGVSQSFHGYSPSQVKSWLTDGFKTDLLDGLSVSPIREKKRYIFVEEGEEMLIDRALSGEDNYMADWTKRERIPGAKVEAEVMFAASVSSRVVNAYNVWLCRAVSSLEASGIDCELTIKFSSQDCFPGAGDGHSIVKVKGENEALDFNSFSAMLSPATLRTFGFTAIALHAESAGKDVASGLGRGRYNVRPTPTWGVNFNPDRRTLEVNCPYMPHDFPSGKMDSELKSAIKAMSGK